MARAAASFLLMLVHEMYCDFPKKKKNTQEREKKRKEKKRNETNVKRNEHTLLSHAHHKDIDIQINVCRSQRHDAL